MRYHRYILTPCLLMLLCLSVRGQVRPPDAKVTMENLFEVRDDYATFEVRITRLSDRWLLWADGTFRVISPTTFPTGGFTDAQYKIEFINGTSDLPFVPYDANAMTGYAVSPRLVNGRVSITIHGPDAWMDCYALPAVGSEFRLGTFSLSTIDGSPIVNDLVIADPEYYLQENAFKISRDSVTGAGGDRNVWYVEHDNVEMITEYETLPIRPPDCKRFELVSFTGKYIGDLTVELAFETKCEYKIRGYDIERALVRPNLPGILDFSDIRLSYTSDSRLVAYSMLLGGRSYFGLLDGVEYRREIYAYRLIAITEDTDERVPLDTIFVRIPNAIISNAVVKENPFRESTSISFNCDDRLTFTGVVYDLGGRHVKYLKNAAGTDMLNVELPKGSGYEVFFAANDIASQGLYNLVLMGKAVDDKTLEEMSRVVFKVQLIK